MRDIASLIVFMAPVASQIISVVEFAVKTDA